MSDLTKLITSVKRNIYNNTNGNITGQVMQNQFIEVINTLNEEKQDTLVSGTTIKTVNGQSILGEGNIEIQGAGTGIADAPSDGKKYVRQDANWVEETTVDTSNFATKDEIPSVDDLATKAEISDMLTKTEAGSTYAAKADLNAKVSAETYEADKATFALKSEIPSVDDLATKAEISDMLTKTEAGSTYAAKADLDSKQDTLVSGTTIKTVNGQSILGEGNIEIQGAGTGIADAPSDGKKYVRQDANWVEETTVDTSNFATKSEITDILTKTEAGSTYATKDELNAKVSTETYNSDKETFATKSEISDMLTKTEAGSTYVAKADLDAKVSTEAYEADKATFALKSELDGKVDDTEISDMLTKTEAGSTYATKSEISDMLTKTEAGSTYAAKSDFNNNENVITIGSVSTTSTNLFGDIIVTASDGKKVKILFNEDNTCKWELVE